LEPRYKVAAAAVPKAIEPGGPAQRRAPVKKKNVLSFAGGEDDSDEVEDEKPQKSGSKKGKSAHDLLNDDKLSREAAYSEEAAAKRGSDSSKRSAPSENAFDAKRQAGSRPGTRGKPVQQKVREEKEDAEDEVDYGDGSDDQKETPPEQQGSASRNETILKLKRDIAGLAHGLPQEDDRKKKVGSALEAMQAGFRRRGETHVPVRGKEGRRREAEAVVAGLKGFQDRLKNFVDADDSDEEGDEKKEAEVGTLSSIWQEGDEESAKDWLGGGGLKFHTSGDKAFELASRKAGNSLEIFDPIAATGNAEALADARKRRSSKMVPSMRRQQPMEKW